MARKRLRRNKRQGMTRRGVSNKRPMNAVQKEALKKLRESTKAANETFNAKQKIEKK